ncbi:dihydropteroate synthase [Parafilimonas terrae]|uniref:dihydropteroate synthase n=1 Tax=Parafilimonas terrae TaxID=1465490 RepID=A0A1I5UX30_9BACT|nr:dihydropteroate synthase [Parafilimonas terrae]SFP99769.1 dihydropteroate synthase [Parafilimonas terrae]
MPASEKTTLFTLNCNGKLLVIDKPVIMGIMNITPDSFYSKSRVQTEDEVLKAASKMIAEGAAILDIGGQSTRPGSTRLSATEEEERLLSAIELIHKNFPGAIISADTYYAAVAEKVIEAGASIINDISGGMMDDNMLATVGKFPVPYICMHMQGRPETMQVNPVYEDVVQEVLDFFILQTEKCRQHNIKDVIIDPGFGFGKTISHNFQLLRNLAVFKMLDRPVLAGLSRKGAIYKTLNVTAEDALNGTTAMNMIALLNGASVLRVHDVKEAAEAIKLFEVYNNAEAVS